MISAGFYRVLKNVHEKKIGRLQVIGKSKVSIAKFV